MDGTAVLPELREPKGPETVKTPGRLGKKWGKCWGRANTTAPPRPPFSFHEQLEWISLPPPPPEINQPLLISSRNPISKAMRKATAQRTPAGCGKRGSPRLPAISTPRASDIRGSRGRVLPQSPARGVRACVRACEGSPASLAKPVALTLLKFIQAARAAEGAHGGRLPAAASLHPRGPRPPSGWALHGAGSRAHSSEDCGAEAEAAASARGSRRRGVARNTGWP